MMMNQIVFWALTSALAGFLFGFDTVVVSQFYIVFGIIVAFGSNWLRKHIRDDCRPDEGASRKFWTWEMRRPILLAFLIAFFNQLSGINAILYFAPRFFESMVRIHHHHLRGHCTFGLVFLQLPVVR